MYSLANKKDVKWMNEWIGDGRPFVMNDTQFVKRRGGHSDKNYINHKAQSRRGLGN